MHSVLCIISTDKPRTIAKRGSRIEVIGVVGTPLQPSAWPLAIVTQRRRLERWTKAEIIAHSTSQDSTTMALRSKACGNVTLEGGV